MTASMAWPEMQDALVRLGDALEQPTTLVVIGSAVCISLGQADRMTMDIDIWSPSSSFDLGVLRRACDASDIIFDPKEHDEPTKPYLQLIEPGIVQLGAFDKTLQLFTTGNLVVKRPPAENVIASKMVRGEAHDFDDAVFLMHKCRVDLEAISKAILSIESQGAREMAHENLSLLQVCIASDLHQKSPAAKPVAETSRENNGP